MISNVREDAQGLALAVAFASGMMAIPWVSIFYAAYGYEFIDRSSYINYFIFQKSILEYKSLDTLLSYISNEFLWHYSVALLVHGIDIPIEYIFGAISFLTLLVFGRITLKHTGPTALLLLVNPLVIDLAFSQVRLALAISLLGIAHLIKDRNNIVSICLVAVAPFVHTASVIFIAIYLSSHVYRLVLQRHGSYYVLEFILLLLLGAFISVLIGPLRETVLSYVGDRRVDYPDASSSFAYSAFWVALLIPLSLSYKRTLQLEYGRYTVVILSIVAVNLLHGGYSTRFLAASFPFIVSSACSLPKQTRIAVLVGFVSYALVQWLYWLRLFGG